MGYDNIIPTAVEGLLKKYNLKISDFSRVVYDCQYPAARRKLNKIISLPPEVAQDDFLDKVGHSGTAQSLVMLSAALDESKPGDKILAFTDGITEARHKQKGLDELYGKERLREMFLENIAKTPDELLQGVLTSVLDFQGTDVYQDDVCLLLITVNNID